MITIEHLTFSYKEHNIFNNFNLNIKKGSFTTLVGPIGSGKTTLIKIILGMIRTNASIKIDNLELCPRNIKKICSKIGILFENPDEVFVAETVMDEMAFILENMNMKRNIIKERIDTIAQQLNIENLLECNPHMISDGEKQIVSLASSLVIEPELLIIDEAFTMIDEQEKKHIFEILKELNKKGMTILNITHDLDESLYSNDILVLQDGKIILHDTKENVLKEEQIMKKAGLELPFLADLSIRLIYYGVLDHMILDMDEMVNAIWK